MSSQDAEAYIAWKPEVRVRGTFSIMVTCFTTLGFCVWSAIHLSIPHRRRKWYRQLGVQLTWVGIGLLLPELLIMAALGQRMAAGRIKKNANFHFFNAKAQFQFFCKRTDTGNSKDGDNDEEAFLTKEATIDDAIPRHSWTTVHGFYAKMGGFAFDYVDRSGRKQRHVLSHANIDYLLETKPHMFPDISESEILDKSKADGLAKLLLFIQVGWFCINTITRLTQGLPLALMEVTTLAHAFCSLSAYLLWWDKPLNVQNPTIISEPDEETRQKLGHGRRGDGISIELTHMSNDVGSMTLWCVIGLSLVYGAPHLIAWNSVFPTHAEKILWRASAVVVTGSGLAFLGMFGGLAFLEGYIGKMPALAENIAMGIGCIAYGASSLYLIAESARQLFHLPPKAFVTPVWSNYFPHL